MQDETVDVVGTTCRTTKKSAYMKTGKLGFSHKKCIAKLGFQGNQFAENCDFVVFQQLPQQISPAKWHQQIIFRGTNHESERILLLL